MLDTKTTTPAQKLAAATLAKALVADAVAKLTTTTNEIVGIVGTGHDVAQSALEARRAAEVLGAKLGNLYRAIERIQ